MDTDRPLSKMSRTTAASINIQKGDLSTLSHPAGMMRRNSKNFSKLSDKIVS
jgi:hypothetical protein